MTDSSRGTCIDTGDPYHRCYASPGGDVRVHLYSQEHAPSQWVETPCVEDVRTGYAMFDPGQHGALGALWDGADFEFLDDGRLRMTLSQWPRCTPTVTAFFNPRDWSVEHDLGGGWRTEPADSLAGRLANTRLHK